MQWADLWGHLFVVLVGGAATGFMALFVWLWKRSIYGEFTRMRECIQELETNFKTELGDAKELAAKNVEQAKGLAAEGLRDIKAALQREVDYIKLGFVPMSVCDESRNGCKDRIFDKLVSLESKIDENKQDRNKQLADLKEDRYRQFEELGEAVKAMIARMDSHINGHNHK